MPDLVLVPVHFDIKHPVTQNPATGYVEVEVPAPIRDAGNNIVYYAAKTPHVLVGGNVTVNIPATDQPGFSSAGYVDIIVHVVHGAITVWKEKRRVGIPWDIPTENLPVEYADLPPAEPIQPMGTYASFTAFQELTGRVDDLYTALGEKGALLTGVGGNAIGSLIVGADGQVLVSDSSTPTGLRWATALPAGTVAPVESVNGMTGEVVLDHEDVGAASATHTHAGEDITSGTVAFDRLPTGTGANEVAIGSHTHSPSSIGAAEAVHQHTIGSLDLSDGDIPQSKVANLVSDLAGKANTAHTHAGSTLTDASVSLSKLQPQNAHTIVANITGSSASPTAVTYAQLATQLPNGWLPQAKVANLVADLAGKASASHAHTIGNVAGLQDELDGKAALSHGHVIGDVSGLQTALDSKQAADADLTAIAALTPANDDILQRKAGAWTNRSLAQLKTDLSLAISDIANLQSTLDGKSGTAHTHTIAGVTNLQNTLDNKQPLNSDLTAIAALTPSDDDVLQRKSGAWVNRTPTQLKLDMSLAISDISGLTAALAGKAGTTHSHTISDVTNLQTTLDGKASATHVHAASDITLGTIAFARLPVGTSSTTVAQGNHTHVASDVGAVPTSREIVAGTGLSGGGDLTTNRVISVVYGSSAGTAVEGNDSRVVNALQTTLAVAKGDLIVATGNDTFTRLPVGTDGQILRANGSKTEGVEWATFSGSGAVDSVNGQTGAVVLTASDVGAADAAHTHDASDIDSGTIGIAHLPVASDGTSSSTEIVRADDSRLSDARTPTAHAASHGFGEADEIIITVAQVTGLEEVLDDKADLSGAAFTGAVTVNGDAVIVEGDARLTNARTPTAHAVSHQSGGDDELAIAASQITSGTLPVSRGGTGLSAVTAGSYVRGTGTGAFEARTPAQVLSDIGAQPADADLTAIAALTPTDNDILQRKSGVWTNRTPAQLKTDLALTKSDVGLGDVDNTSDLDKPISTATQVALDGKSNVGHTHAISDVTDLVTTLAGKAAVSHTHSSGDLDVGTGAGQIAAGDHVHNPADIGAAATVHTHSGADITSGTVPFAHLPVGTASNQVAAGDHGHVIADVTGLQGALDALTDISTLNVRNFGAVGDGVTDDTAAFHACINAAKDAVRVIPDGLWGDRMGSVVIYVPAGDYLVTDSILGPEDMDVKAVGIKFQGAGDGITTVIYKPSTAGNLFENDYWQGLYISDIAFYAGEPDCTFLFSDTTNNAQRYQFNNCTFRYWKYGIRLEGDNNNSEFLFLYCHTNLIQNDGAFFYIGDTNTSDQFVNYWFYGCSHWSTSAPFLDVAKGGHFHIYGLDVSDWGTDLLSTGYVFNLRGSTHAYGVCAFTVNGLRVEAKNNAAALLYSEWPQGLVSFRNADWASQTFIHTYGDIIRISYNNVDGATYSFYDCQLAGGVLISFGANEWQHRHRITFENCVWYQRKSPSEVVAYDTSGAGGNVEPKPPVEFRGCRYGETNDVFNAAGAPVWDAIIGFRGDLLQNLQPRVVSIRSVYGMPRTLDDPVTVVLPVGALITGFEVLSPEGVVTEGDGGAWKLETTEVVPTTVATATVSGAMADGFHVEEAVSPPFYCDTADKATLTVVAENVDQYNSVGLVLIKGYW